MISALPPVSLMVAQNAKPALSRGRGPEAVITNLCILKPDHSGELVLAAVHPGTTIEQVKENTGWQLRVADEIRVTDPPTPEELRILHEELDPDGIYLK